MSRTPRWVSISIFAVLLAASGRAQSALEIADRAQQRTRSQSEHYEGSLQVIDSGHKVTEKRWVFDRTGSHGNSKTVLRFTAPAEVKGVALLILNHPDRASDQWMWTPALARDRRVALQDRSARFFGTDFSFEDLEERDVGQFSYKLLGEESLVGAPCWKLESQPKQTKTSQYGSSQLWIRKADYVLLRLDHFRPEHGKEQLVRRIEYSSIAEIQDIPSAQKIEVTDFTRNSRTLLVIDKLRYNLPVKDTDFTVEALRRAQ
jgi:hypothetical protein